MKQFLVVLILVLNIPVAHAQRVSDKSTVLKRAREIAFLINLNRAGNAEMKTTYGVLNNRVIAQSTRNNTLDTLADSVALRYSPHNGSVYDYNTMIYPYNYPYRTSPMFNFEGVFTKPQIMCDSYIHWTLDPTTLAYGLYEWTSATYDLNKNLVALHDIFADSVYNSNTSYTNTFNTNNNISAGRWFVWIGGVKDSAFKQFFTYDTGKRLIKDSIYEYHGGTWHLAAKTIYSYSAAHNLAQIDCYGNTTDTSFTAVLQEQLQYSNTYDAANRLLTVSTKIFDGTALLPSGKDTFAYTGTHPFHTSWRDYQYDNINGYWAPMFKMTKTLNAAGYPDTVNIQGFDSLMDSWVPRTLEIARYDTAHNPDTLFEYDYNFTAYPPSPDYTTVYYYDTFRNVSAVAQVSDLQTFSIYPNPATDNITIACTQGHNDYLIEIVNMEGRLLYREKQRGTTLFTSISLSAWLPGMYQVIIRSAEGKLLSTQKVLKK